SGEPQALSGDMNMPAEMGTSDYESGMNDWAEAGAGGSFDPYGEADPFENSTARPSLRDHLFEQIHVDFQGRGFAAATLLCDYWDEAGYLRADVIELAAQLHCSVEDLVGVVGRLQKLDPPGIFARNLAECLELQLAERGLLSLSMAKLLANLDLL